MKRSVRYEQFALVHRVPYPDGDLCVSWSELRKASIGKVWSVDDQDTFPNRSRSWTVEYTVVYRDTNGVLVKKSSDNEFEETELLWFEFS